MVLQPLSAVNPIAGYYSVFALAYSFITTIIFIIRREHAPIPKRLPIFTVIFVIGMQLFIFTGSVFTVNVICVGWVYLGQLATMLCFGSYILRVRYIIQKYNLNKEAADEKKVDNEEEYKKLKKLSKKTQLRSIFIILGCLTVIHIILAVIGEFTDPLVISGCTLDINRKSTIILDIIPSVFYLLAIFYYLVAIRNVKDSFGIATEMKIVAITILLCMILYLLIDSFGVDLTPEILPSMAVLTQTAVVTWPIFESFRRKYSKIPEEEDLRDSAVSAVSNASSDERLSSAKKELSSVNRVLHHPIAVRYFTEYLISELSVENIIFLKAVEHFHTDPNIKSAQKIYNDFIVDGAPTELNINFKIKDITRNKLSSGEITADLFDNIKTVIIRQLEEDNWVRFQRSEHFKKAVLEYSQSNESITA